MNVFSMCSPKVHSCRNPRPRPRLSPGASAALRLESQPRPGDGRRAAARSPQIPHTEVVLTIISRILALAIGASLTLTQGARAADLDTPSPPPPAPAAPAPSGGWFDVSTWPFIPVPEIGVDPDSGVTLGVLPVWLRTSDQHEITRIFAPDLIENPNFGVGGHFRVFEYP